MGYMLFLFSPPCQASPYNVEMVSSLRVTFALQFLLSPMSGLPIGMLMRLTFSDLIHCFHLLPKIAILLCFSLSPLGRPKNYTVVSNYHLWNEDLVAGAN